MRIRGTATWGYGKLRHYGGREFFRIAGQRLWASWAYQRHWLLKPQFYRSLIRLIAVPRWTRRRILGIWDFKALPWSVGDPLVFIEALSVLKLQHDAEEVDVCVVYDREDPAGTRGNISGNHNVSSDDGQDHLLNFLPLLSTSPFLGSVYQFNSRAELHRFLKDNLDRYDVFPPLAKHLGETYNYYGGAPDICLIQQFHNAQGYIPHLRISTTHLNWARRFYAERLRPDSIPVAVSLKLTPHNPIRNADPDVWLAFIDRCARDLPEVVFVVVGMREEVIEGLRQRPNVVIAKNFGTTIVEDLALIRGSFVYMGTNSGVNTIAWFSDLPYLIFQVPVPTLNKYGLQSNEMFSFLTDDQRIFSTEVSVTPALLFDEFATLYARLDRDAWRLARSNDSISLSREEN